MSTNGTRHRRTSVSSTTSTRSWRVPLAKQPPRTQLSAVFAEFEPSRSPSNQSASALLEARFVSSSPSQNALSTSPSPSVDNARLSSSYQSSPNMESLNTPVESPSKINPVGSPVPSSRSGWFSRGRQSTQRHISLVGDADSVSPPADRQERPPSTPMNISDSSKSPEALPIPSGQPAAGVAPQTIAPQAVDLQSTQNPTTPSIVVEAPTKKRQNSIGGGWFSTSGRSKAQKLQTSNPIAEAQPTQNRPSISSTSALTSSAPKVVEPVVEATVVPPVKADTTKVPSTKPASSSSSRWFSRTPQERLATPSKALEQKPIPTPEVQISEPSNTNPPISQPIPLPATNNPIQETTSSAAASPSRSSWFGSFRGRGTPQPVVPAPNELGVTIGTEPSVMIASGNNSVQPSPSLRSIDLPQDVPLADSIIDESMMATVTPMSFAQAQSQNQSSKPAVPSSWFRLGSKRNSITPSVDSTVPSLPPSPKREFLQPLTTLVPVSNASVTSLGSSSARYTLTLPLLGKPKMDLKQTLKGVVEVTGVEGLTATPSRANHQISNEVIAVEVVPDPETIQSTQGSSAASIASSYQPPPSSASWWPFWSGAPPAAPTEGSSNPSQLNTSDLGNIPPAAPSSVAGDSHIASSSGSIQEESQQAEVPPVPSSASWFGFWPWGAEGAEPPTQPTKTEAELIKEEALARGNQPSSLPTSPGTVVPDQPTPRPDSEQNPLAQDMIDNRASWASFFSLRAAHGAKKVTVQGEFEEEVMEIDVNAEVPPSATQAHSVSVTATPAIVGKKVAGIIASGTSTPLSKPRSSSAGPGRRDPPKPPLTDSDSIRQKVVSGSNTTKRSSSATPSKRSLPPPAVPKAPNMILPTFGDTFYTLPRALPPHTRPTTLKKVGRLVSGVLGITSSGGGQVPNDEMREWQARSGANVPRSYEGLRSARDVGKDLPRVGEVLGIQDVGRIRDCKRVAILGVHGWFPGTIMRTLLGEPTGTSPKFASMMENAVKKFMEKQGVTLEKITSMPLEGEGTIEKRVEKLYQNFLANKEWVEDLHEADVVFVATHSQGSIVSTQLLDRLIADGHIRTSKNWELVKATMDTAIGGIGITIPPVKPPQRVCCLALCGIHLGPLLYLGTSSIVNPYIQYFESAAAKELFEFQETETEVSKKYIDALENVLDHGTKFVYVASLDDQVVPIYSGIFTAVNHPRILRALYIDGDAYNTSDFLSNLLVLLLRLRNAGIDDGGLLTHLSEATAGSLSGVGHSSAYLDPGAYDLAVRFLFETSDALGDEPKFEFEPFSAKASRNDYEIPWALRGLIADPRCQELFGKEIAELRNAFDDWQPRTTVLKDVRKKLEPIRGRRSSKL
ncbi:hypothetical protein CPB86DRAFT_791078 [Serendipita vermifera]|nr:hypothetical protein CPB86DRAFT_791078 [Serendipita vermifera]